MLTWGSTNKFPLGRLKKIIKKNKKKQKQKTKNKFSLENLLIDHFRKCFIQLL